MNFVHYLPIMTTLIAAPFSLLIYKRYRKLGGTHLLWWSGGVLIFGLGTFTESWITLLGWNVTIFRFWYIAGALLGGAPLAQGTVWLLLQPKTAKLLTIILILFVVTASVFVWMSPIEMDKVDPNLPSGKVFTWQWVRGFSPFLNSYAVIFLIGGAVFSALRYRREMQGKSLDVEIAHDRFIGNVFIAIGAILPGIGGAASRAGYTEPLYIGEFIGIMLIWTGYWFNTGKIDRSRQEIAEIVRSE